MIVTLTPNPSIDRSVTVPSLLLGEVNRATESRIDPGGKGINVSRALAANGIPTRAVLPTGGPEGHLMTELLDAAGVEHTSVAVPGTLRMNVAVLEPGGTTTKINEPGPTLGESEVSSLLEVTVRSYLESTRPGEQGWIVGCGSLPPGAPADFFARLIERGHEVGALVAVDSSGEPLREALAAGPDLIKPNKEELEELLGRPLPTLGQVHHGAAELVRSGVGTVVVSLGGDGALLVGAAGAFHAGARVDQPVSTVGAGDCLLAGVLAALTAGLSWRDVVASGVRWGSAAVALPGSVVPGPSDLDAVQVWAATEPDPTHPLG